MKLFNDLDIIQVTSIYFPHTNEIFLHSRIFWTGDPLPPYEFWGAFIEIMKEEEIVFFYGIYHELEHYDVFKALLSIGMSNREFIKTTKKIREKILYSYWELREHEEYFKKERKKRSFSRKLRKISLHYGSA